MSAVSGYGLQNLVTLASQLLDSKHQNKWKGIEMDNDKKKPDPKEPMKKLDFDGGMDGDFANSS